ncbi:methyl-accepting chemotaxis protein [Emcibacter nanhaiensis]|uniref:HAMP domain-containing protein n=1 Tax=Emcibacter nanhaiensis TaxID=1505037 RepID=A0A501PP49_9PROT|nr:methyl-accepting chemotaxis protein [Emcibacter nanhaiensis]TPD61566.1 HAMP domain-containing protein [Emcibacter nanhaiensis]
MFNWLFSLTDNLLSKFTISRRIFLLAGLTILSMVMLTIGFVWNYGKINSEFHSYQDYERQGRLGSELFSLGREIRQDEKSFLLHPEDDLLAQHGKTSRRLTSILDDYAQQAENGEVKSALKSLQDKSKTYQDRFSSLASGLRQLGYTEEDGLRGKLKQSGQKAEEALDETNLPEIQVALLKTRKAEQDYIRLGDKASQRWYKIHLRTVKKGIPQTNISRERKDLLLGYIAAYEKSFADFVQHNEEVKEASTRLDEIYSSMVPDFKSVMDLARTGRENAERTYDEAKSRFVVTMALVAVIALVAYLLLSLPLTRSLTRPIRKITEAMRALSDGEDDVQIDLPAQNNEIGKMVSAIERFRENLGQMEQARLEQAREKEQRLAAEKRAAEQERQLAMEKMEREEEDKRRSAEKQARLEQVCLEFEATMRDVLRQVRSASVEMEGSAREMFSLADSTSARTEALAAASEQSNQNMSAVSVSAGDLEATVDQISGRVRESAQGTSGAVEEIEQANIHIQHLEDASQKIGAVVSLINDIAEQTNLLALNATIEAARAGDAGRGFAVVASEVKNLAGQTAEATSEIAAQVSGMRDATMEAVRTMRLIGDTIRSISGTSEDIASSVHDQEEATREIVRSVKEVSGGMGGILENVVSVSHDAQNTSRVANDVLSNANRLNAESEKLNQKFEQFLRDIKSAS